jgi:hypothetical protein
VLHRAVQLPLSQLSAKSSPFSKNLLPIKAGFFPPKQAPGKVQRSKAALLLWHLDHPNLAMTPGQVMSPTQEAPIGHPAQSQYFGSEEVSLRYWNSLQSDGFVKPLSWHKLNPLALLLYPVGQALQKALGKVF